MLALLLEFKMVTDWLVKHNHSNLIGSQCEDYNRVNESFYNMNKRIQFFIETEFTDLPGL